MDRQIIHRQLRETGAEEALLFVHDNGGSVTRSQLKDLLGDDQSVQQATDRLRDLALISSDEALDGSLDLTRTGNSMAEYITHSRQRGADRRAAIQRALLTWIKEHRSPPSAGSFLGAEEATAWGSPFSKEEIAAEATWLKDNGLIAGQSSWGGDIIRPEITSLGRDALDSPDPFSEFLRGPGMTYHDHSRLSFGDHTTVGGVQSGGHGNVQNIQQTVISDDLRQQILDVVDDAQRALEESDPDNAQGHEAIEQLRAEAQDPSTTVDKVKQLATAAVITAGTSEVVRSGLSQLLSML